METLKEMNNPRRSEAMKFSNYRSMVIGTMIVYYNDKQEVRLGYEVCVYVDEFLYRAYYNIISPKEMDKIFYKSVKNVLKIEPAKLDIDSLLPF